ncbi:MAG: hypothetical protein LBH43_06790 [Treponema sp.]|jgi:spore coat protein U-like protein|nr:hypothetical protein [Treponema sp.]
MGKDNYNITFYKFAHASSSSGVSQSFDRAASLNSMASDIDENFWCFTHAIKLTTSSIQCAGSVSISCNKTARFVVLLSYHGKHNMKMNRKQATNLLFANEKTARMGLLCELRSEWESGMSNKQPSSL